MDNTYNGLVAWLGLGTSVVALVLPWITHWWRVYRPGALLADLTGNAELTFGALGPSILLRLTFRTGRARQFVRDVSVKVVRMRDNATHVFEWSMFRHQTTSSFYVEAVAGFMLLPDDVVTRSILFTERAMSAETQDTVRKLSAAWQSVAPVQAASRIKMPMGDYEHAQRFDSAYENFKQSKVASDAFSKFSRETFWERAEYAITVYCGMARSRMESAGTWRFSVTEDEASSLRVNAVPVIDDACLGGSRPLSFVNVRPKESAQKGTTREP